ncbi:MAG TPA: sigma-70 family RNA polymerase sigma factor [Stellaceae bacterium]|nr:sigma-70 family RNA polymerase sigma factor [Stellaceae bacterium]
MADITNPDNARAVVLAELMMRVARFRDSAAFGQLFDDVAPRVKRYLLRQGCDGGVAEDLTQEVMLTVWQRAEIFDPGRSTVSTWVFTIARNRRIDFLRRQRRPEVDWNDPLLIPSDGISAEEKLLTEARGVALRGALADLPKEQAELLAMAYFDDRSQSWIAQEQRLPLGTVKSRLRLALARLRKALGDDA